MDVKSMLDNAKNQAEQYNDNIFGRIMYNSRQNEIGDLSPWMKEMLESVVCKPLYFYHGHEHDIVDYVISCVLDYVEKTKVKNFVVGVSGGADSATTLALLKAAQVRNPEIKIHAWTLPINQKKKEVDLAKEVCEFLDIELHSKDLTEVSNAFLNTMEDGDGRDRNIRRGNLFARMRMSYLYDVAKRVDGIVVSTDNFSEYSAGFWTINGDVGDFAPLQSFYKSTEIPVLAGELGLPEKFWRVVPTDGLGISNSDEEQLGMSYLEWDILTTLYMSVIGITNKYAEEKSGISNIRFDYESVKDLMRIGILDDIEASEADVLKIEIFLKRMYSTWYKRYGTIRVDDGVIHKLELLNYTERASSIPTSDM